MRPGGEDSAKDWTHVASKSGTLPDGASITAAELTGVTCLISFLQSYYTSYKSALTNIKGTNSLDHKHSRMLALADIVCKLGDDVLCTGLCPGNLRRFETGNRTSACVGMSSSTGQTLTGRGVTGNRYMCIGGWGVL